MTSGQLVSSPFVYVRTLKRKVAELVNGGEVTGVLRNIVFPYDPSTAPQETEKALALGRPFFNPFELTK